MRNSNDQLPDEMSLGRRPVTCAPLGPRLSTLSRLCLDCFECWGRRPVTCAPFSTLDSSKPWTLVIVILLVIVIARFSSKAICWV
jgi:hypothetical protein